ncbi:ead/Ea22-like family protein [Aeromonas jandaei]|nr:ead/Ea22-like family protein [Aeromonas jandaei]UCA31981.1 ead/Ea22-like family protein [Aeromonas jandaei]
MMSGFTKEQLQELRWLAEQATEGEWEAVNDGNRFGVVRIKGSHRQIAGCTMPDDEERHFSPLEINSRYIAAAGPEVVLALLDRLDELTPLVDACKFLGKANRAENGGVTGAFRDGINMVIEEEQKLSDKEATCTTN